MDPPNQQADTLALVVREPLNKRYRQKFSAEDKDLFIRILKEHLHVIERKEGDVVTLKRKHAAWRMVLKTYNEGASSERDLHQLRLLWKRMKKGASAPVIKEEHFAPEEFTVMVNPFDINTTSVNPAEPLKSSIPTPSPDSSDRFDFNRGDDDSDINPLQIVLEPESPVSHSEAKEIRKKNDRNNNCINLEPKVIQVPGCISFEPKRVQEKTRSNEISAYERRLLEMAEKEHLQKMALFKRRKQNEELKEELFRLKIKTQLMKQERVKMDTNGLCVKRPCGIQE